MLRHDRRGANFPQGKLKFLPSKYTQSKRMWSSRVVFIDELLRDVFELDSASMGVSNQKFFTLKAANLVLRRDNTLLINSLTSLRDPVGVDHHRSTAVSSCKCDARLVGVVLLWIIFAHYPRVADVGSFIAGDFVVLLA